MSDIFSGAARRLKASPFIIPIFAVFILMLVIGVGIFIEDYSTSFEGYRILPTRKFNDWIIYLVALLPQIGQIGFAYVFATDTSKRWAITIALVLHTVDVGTDVVYKAWGQNPGTWLIALAESEVIYTLGSEILIVTAIGMLIHLFPSVISIVGDTFGHLWGNKDSSPVPPTPNGFQGFNQRHHK